MTESATKSSRNDSRATSAVARAAGKINKNNRSVHLYARVSERSICCGALDINQRLNNLWRQSSTVAATGSKETLFSRQLSDNQYEVCSSIRRVLRINHVPLHLTRLSIKKNHSAARTCKFTVHLNCPSFLHGRRSRGEGRGDKSSPEFGAGGR